MSSVQRLIIPVRQAVRSFHSSPCSAGGEYAWMHDKQFNFPEEKNRALKYGGGIFAIAVTGFGIPFFAAWWQIEKAKG